MNRPYLHPVSVLNEKNKITPRRCPGCGLGSILFALLDALLAEGGHLSEYLWVMGTGCLHLISQALPSSVCQVEVDDGRLGETLYKALSQLLRQSPSRISAPGEPLGKVFKQFSKNQKLKGALVLMNNLDLLLSGATDWLELARKMKKAVSEGSPKKESSNLRTSSGLKRLFGGLDYQPPWPVIIIHVNNCLYVTNETHLFAATPLRRKSVDNQHELPFNLPKLFAQLEPVLLARWTPLHGGWLRESLSKSLGMDGLSFIEVITPCVVWDASHQRLLSAAERLGFYDRASTFWEGSSADEFDLRQNKIVVGEVEGKELTSPGDKSALVQARSHLLTPLSQLSPQMGNLRNNNSRPCLHIEEELCQGCGLCIELCQAQVLCWAEGRNQLGYRYPRVINQENCLDCGLCEMYCPELAIQVKPSPEIHSEESG